MTDIVLNISSDIAKYQFIKRGMRIFMIKFTGYLRKSTISSCW